MESSGKILSATCTDAVAALIPVALIPRAFLKQQHFNRHLPVCGKGSTSQEDKSTI